MRDPQASVAGVRFRNAGKIFYFHAAGMRLEVGEYVVVETARGPEIGRIVIAPDQVVINELGREELKPILRLATEADIMRMDALRQRAAEFLPQARQLAEESGFPAHIDAAEFTLDGRRITFSFTSDERIDYRDFIRRAGERFGAKVDMRQMGARDRAKLAGGYGICGRELCCASWLATFPSISIRMAKEQDLPLNPQKISGLCGRLLCCLSYEEEGYKEMRKTLPRVGQRCSTPTGEGRVIAINILRREVTLVVEGQRVEVPDRDLGLVVRWDAASKSGDPPPSISRAEAIAQGLIEATDDDLLAEGRPHEGAEWLAAEPARTPGRGRLPGNGPRKEPPSRPQADPGSPARSSRPVPRERPAQQPAEAPRQANRQSAGPQRDRRPSLPEGRPFQRSQPSSQPPPPRPSGSVPGQPRPAGEAARPAGTGRRRGRRGRGGGGPQPPAEQPG